jgi:hypothetical protein
MAPSVCLMAVALVISVGCGLLVPYTLGIADPLLDLVMVSAVGLTGYVSSLVLGRSLLAQLGSVEGRGQVLALVAISGIVVATVIAATCAATRLPHLMELRVEGPRVLGSVAAFVTVLLVTQWAVIGVSRDLGAWWRAWAGRPVRERSETSTASPASIAPAPTSAIASSTIATAAIVSVSPGVELGPMVSNQP